MMQKRVMLDSDLAELYGVTTRRLNEQVHDVIRNDSRLILCFSWKIKKLRS